jgi:RNA polymerase sigma-70 factor (ECF subfamily)
MLPAEREFGSYGGMEGTGVEELVRRAMQGEEAASAALVSRYGERVRAFVRKRMPPSLRSREDSEDILQTALVTAFANLAKIEYRGEAQFVRWLSAVALQKLLRSLRRHRAGKRDLGREAALSDVDRLPRDQTTASQAAMRNEGRARLSEAVAGLPEEERRVVDFRSRGGLGFREVAERVGLADADAARYVYRRAIRRLGRALAEDDGSAP